MTVIIANKGRILDLFREWDTDGDGRIDKAEFKRALEELEVLKDGKEGIEQFKAIWGKFDPDGSGVIDLEELKKIMQTARASASRTQSSLKTATTLAPDGVGEGRQGKAAGRGALSDGAEEGEEGAEGGDMDMRAAHAAYLARRRRVLASEVRRRSGPPKTGRVGGPSHAAHSSRRCARSVAAVHGDAAEAPGGVREAGRGARGAQAGPGAPALLPTRLPGPARRPPSTARLARPRSTPQRDRARAFASRPIGKGGEEDETEPAESAPPMLRHPLPGRRLPRCPACGPIAQLVSLTASFDSHPQSIRRETDPLPAAPARPLPFWPAPRRRHSLRCPASFLGAAPPRGPPRPHPPHPLGPRCPPVSAGRGAAAGARGGGAGLGLQGPAARGRAAEPLPLAGRQGRALRGRRPDAPAPDAARVARRPRPRWQKPSAPP